MKKPIVKKYDHINWTGLRRLRETLVNPLTDKHYTQAEMAARIGIKQQTYSLLENGNTRSPNDDIVKKLAIALGTDPSDLLEALPKKNPAERASDTQFIEKRFIPKYYLQDRPRDFPYPDGVLLQGGDTTEVPPMLQHVIGGYAVVMPSDAMEPRYREGDVLFVNPEQQVYYGDDVVLRVRYKNRTIGVVREVINQEPTYGLRPDPMQAVALMPAQLKQQLTFEKSGEVEGEIDPLELFEFLSEKSDWIVLDDEDSADDDTDDEGAILSIMAHVIVGSERKRFMRERRRYSDPDSIKSDLPEPQDMHEYFARRELEVVGEA